MVLFRIEKGRGARNIEKHKHKHRHRQAERCLSEPLLSPWYI